MPRKARRPRTPAEKAARKLKAQQARGRVTMQARVKLATARSAVNLPDPDPAFAVPEFTLEVATELALLLHAGVPRDRVGLFLLPKVEPALRDRTMREWFQSPLLLQASNHLQGGEWHKLSKDRRLELALDKHLAEMAYFLVTHRFDDEEADGKMIARMSAAREALRGAVSGQDSRSGDVLDGFVRFLAEVQKGRVQFNADPVHPAAVGAPQSILGGRRES